MHKINVTLLSLFLIACVMIQHLYCNKPRGETVTKTEYIHDTTTYTVTKEKLVPYDRVIKLPSKTDTLKLIDTVEFVREFHTMYIYKDSLIDSNIRLVVIDTVFKNEIIGRGYQYNLLKPQTIINNTTINGKRLSFGAQVGYGITNKGLSPYIGLGINYKIPFK